MNLNHVQSTQTVLPALKPVGNRIDVTSREATETVSEIKKSASQTGSISGILTAEENLAIASMFPASKGVYTSQGGTQIPKTMPGSNLDVQA